MSRDPIVEEVRKARRKIEEDCEKRGESYFDYILKEQEKNRDRLVSFIEAPKSTTGKKRTASR